MKTNFLLPGAFIGVMLFFCGCSSSDVEQISKNTYKISKTGTIAGPLSDVANLRTSVILEAKQFAESKGKVAIATTARDRFTIRSSNSTLQSPVFEYQFILVDKDDPRARSRSIPDPNVFIGKK